ncbi:MAG: spore coat protein [Bacillota bacterium]|nr:spore coat protein [Bacillota bacterium]
MAANPGSDGMSEREIVEDSLSTQKFLASTADTYANEASSDELRSDLLNVLQEDHQLQAKLFQAASQRGWYQVKQASDQEVSQAQSKHRNMPG